MTDLLRLLVDVFGLLWPFRVVRAWEHGVQYVWGRYWRTVGPGVYPVIPWFMDVLPVSVVPSAWGTPLQTITLRDGRTLTFSALATLRVVDPAAALNEVQEWQETTMEVVSGILANRLAEEETDSFKSEYGRRKNLLERLRKEAAEEATKYGISVEMIRFTNFAVGLRAHRLLLDRATYAETTIGAI